MNKKWLSVKQKRQTKPKTKQKWKSIKKRGGNMFDDPYAAAVLVASIAVAAATAPAVFNVFKNTWSMQSIKADGMTYVDNMLIDVLNKLSAHLGNPSEIIAIKNKLCINLTNNNKDIIKSNIEINDYIFLMGVPARILGHYDTNRKQKHIKKTKTYQENISRKHIKKTYQENKNISRKHIKKTKTYQENISRKYIIRMTTERLVFFFVCVGLLYLFFGMK